ncbi:hypothetical protein KPSA1B_103588 [Pseudomonas syringae pv. actinidiae]|uniref:Intein/homing endonuclease n=3 Tax=Pseudomonas syringae TaxID=317 RepID=A0A2V0Q3S5_PSESF|nr:hypothetical protein KPSA1B_103588 [Pseudomonas syringae pv. actinidiae]GBH07109.1 Intein/homing endonuclease [Pseudomonas syringae pv. actinidiae]
MSAVIAFAGVHKSREAHRSGFCPEGVGASGGYDGCDGLRSGPETGYLGCIWYTEAAGFTVGSRQIVDKSTPTASGQNQKQSCVPR